MGAVAGGASERSWTSPLMLLVPAATFPPWLSVTTVPVVPPAPGIVFGLAWSAAAVGEAPVVNVSGAVAAGTPLNAGRNDPPEVARVRVCNSLPTPLAGVATVAVVPPEGGTVVVSIVWTLT